jgi:hypothetical protein
VQYSFPLGLGAVPLKFRLCFILNKVGKKFFAN